MAVAARRTTVPADVGGASWAETIDQSPDTSTQDAPRLLESARLKSSLKLVMVDHLLPVDSWSGRDGQGQGELAGWDGECVAARHRVRCDRSGAAEAASSRR